MSTPERKLELGRVGESVRRIDATQGRRRVRLRERPLRGRHALGPHRPEPTCARAHNCHRHDQSTACRASTRCSRTRTFPARSATASSSPTARARLRPRPLSRRACGDRRGRAPGAARRRGGGSSTSRSSRSSTPERATEVEPIHLERADRRPRLPGGPAPERRPPWSSATATSTPRRTWSSKGRTSSASGPGVPRPGVRAGRSRRRGRRRHLRRNAVAARRPRPGRALPRADAEPRAHPPRGVVGAPSADARTCPCRSTGPCWLCTRTAP